MKTKRNYRNNIKHYEKSPNLAEIEIRYKTKPLEKAKVTSSKDAFSILFPLYNKVIIEYLEQFYLLLLNRANIVLGWVKLSSGGTIGTVVDAKIIFTLALKTNTSGIILSHNFCPSEVDRCLTKCITDTTDLFEIKIIRLI